MVVKEPVAKKRTVRKITKRTPLVSKSAKIRASVFKRDDRKHSIRRDFLDEDVPLEKASLRIYFIGIAFAIILVVVTLGTLFAKGKVATNLLSEFEEVQEVVVTEVEEVSEELVEVLEPEDITLEILNGSGKSGLAGDTKEEFESLGYVVETIGNSENIEEGELYISNTYSEEELEELLEDVKRRLDITEVKGILKDLETTARIILGEE